MPERYLGQEGAEQFTFPPETQPADHGENLGNFEVAKEPTLEHDWEADKIKRSLEWAALGRKVAEKFPELAIGQAPDQTSETELNNQEAFQPQDISRRTFLKATAATIGLAASNYAFGQQEITQSGLEKPVDFKELTGLPLAEVAEKHDYAAHLVVDNGDGDYILHIGQYHRPLSRQDMLKYGHLVRESQNNISGILLDLKEINPEFNQAYVEGETKESLALLNFFKQMESDFSAVQPSKQTWRELSGLIDSQEATLKDIIGPDDSFGPDSILTLQFLRTYVKHFTRLQQASESSGLILDQEEQEHFKKSEKKFLDWRQALNLSPFGDESVDGIYQLYFRGEIDIKPAASDEDNEKMSKLLGGEINLPKNEQRQIGKIKKILLDEREDYAVRKIASDLRKNGDPKKGETAVLVYGAGHSFDRAVKANNKGRRSVGLIELRPKQSLPDEGLEVEINKPE